MANVTELQEEIVELKKTVSEQETYIASLTDACEDVLKMMKKTEDAKHPTRVFNGIQILLMK